VTRTCLGYALTVALPLIYLGTLNPVVFCWRLRYGTATVPPHVQLRVDKFDASLPFLALALLAVIVTWSIDGWPNGSISYLFMSINSAAVLVGALAGCAWLAMYLALLWLVRPSREALRAHLVVRWSPARWLALSLPAAFVEEAWRAVSLQYLAPQGWHVAVAINALAFGCGHLPQPARALSAAAFAVVAANVLRTTGTVWGPILAHGIVNAGVLMLIRYWRASIAVDDSTISRK